MISIEYICALVRIAASQVGNREEGNNGGEAVRKYQAATTLKVGSWPWCAAFVCWCIREAAKLQSFPLEIPRTALCLGFISWAKKNGLAVIHSPKSLIRGDIVIFKFKTGYHIGIVSKDSSFGSFTSIEGNTDGSGSRDGDGVYFRTRSTSSVFAVIAWRRLKPISEK